MKPFQIGLIAVCVIATITAVAIFSISGKSTSGPNAPASLTIWGTLDRNEFQSSLDAFQRAPGNSNTSINYLQIEKKDIYQSIIEGLASGYGPDLFFVDDSLVYKLSDKITPIAYTTLDIGTYQNTFIPGANIFLSPSKGTMAVPLFVDPLVMYYNKSILNTNLILYPPSNWTELKDMTSKLVETDTEGQITKTAIALGEYSNIQNAKAILSALSLEAGGDFVKPQMTRTEVVSDVVPINSPLSPLAGALTLFSSFSNPDTNVYSWNASLPNDKEFFVQGKSAFYLGFASEYKDIAFQNPNLDFEIARIPQLSNAVDPKTFASFTGLAVAKNSKNLDAATNFALFFATPDASKKIVETLNTSNTVLASPLRVFSKTTDPKKPYVSVLYGSTFISRSWLDPEPNATNEYFKTMINSYNSSSVKSVNDAISSFSSGLRSLSTKIY